LFCPIAWLWGLSQNKIGLSQNKTGLSQNETPAGLRTKPRNQTKERKDLKIGLEGWGEGSRRDGADPGFAGDTIVAEFDGGPSALDQTGLDWTGLGRTGQDWAGRDNREPGIASKLLTQVPLFAGDCALF
jgi:hypothetical protein